MGRYGTALIAAFIAMVASAQASEVIQKHGTCPSGFRAVGEYCVSNEDMNRAFDRHGTCPSGWVASGSGYCKRFGQ